MRSTPRLPNTPFILPALLGVLLCPWPAWSSQGKELHAGRLLVSQSHRQISFTCPAGNRMKISSDGRYQIFQHGKAQAFESGKINPALAKSIKTLNLSAQGKGNVPLVERKSLKTLIHAVRKDQFKQNRGKPPAVGNAFEHLLFTPIRLKPSTQIHDQREGKALGAVIQKVLHATGTEKGQLAHFTVLLARNQLRIEKGTLDGVPAIRMTCPVGWQITYKPGPQEYTVKKPAIWKDLAAKANPTTGSISKATYRTTSTASS